MDLVKKKINESRNIKENSLRAYTISINKIHYALFKNHTLDKDKPLDFLKKTQDVLDTIKDLKLNTKKNYISAIIVGLSSMGDYDDELIIYREKLEKLNKEYKDIIEKNEKDDNQKENWVSLFALKQVMNSYKRDLLDREVFKKKELTKTQTDILQMWVVANLYLHDSNPPIRLDYGNMKMINNTDFNNLSETELDNNNYLIVKSRTTKSFHFAQEKTKRTYGIKTIRVGKVLNSVLNIWLKFNKTSYLLIDSRNQAMTSNKLSKYITKVFQPTGKKITINTIRHIYISEKHPVSVNENKKKTADLMGHSVNTQEAYSKN